MPGNCFFNDLWLDHKYYKEWIKKDDNKNKAYCKVCKKSIDLARMGESALTSHQNGKKHTQNLRASRPAVSIDNFLLKSNVQQTTSATDSELIESNANLSSSVPVTTTTSATPSAIFASSDVLKAEIIWTLNSMNSHYSFKSCENNSTLFAKMFPDSQIAQHYQCGEKKTAYLASFGLAPYFLSMLKANVKAADEYVLLFDESLNHELQSKQMDIHVRFWDEGTVASCYLTSEFLGHSTANDVLSKLDDIVRDFSHKKLVQLSMDGPNVNWKLYMTLQEQIEQKTSMKMLQTGSCGLHTLHNAFRAGCTASDWEIEDCLSSLFTLFNDTPARREDFLALTGCQSFPLKFCKHRWLENIKAAERAIFIMPQIVQYCTAAKLKKITCPTSKSFAAVMKMTQDPLIYAKLHFFLMIARDVEPFLKRYQSDKPMLPFMAEDLGMLLKKLMGNFIKSDILDTATSLFTLAKVDVSDRQNWIDITKIGVGYSAGSVLRDRNSKATDHQKLDFRRSCRDFLVALTHKILERSPIKYPLVRALSWMDPRHMAERDKRELNAKKLRQTLDVMVSANRITTTMCDQVTSQYSALLGESDGNVREMMIGFSLDDDRLDTFLYRWLFRKKGYSELWDVMKQMLVLSHGQASVERGFSVNKELTVENLKEHTLVARRVIVDHVRKVGGVLNVPITKGLLLSASSARQRYHQYLEDAKKEEKAKEGERKRKAEEDMVADLKEKKKRMEEDIKHLLKQADMLYDEAEHKQKLTLLSEANALKHKAKEKEKSVTSLQKQIDDKLCQLRKA